MLTEDLTSEGPPALARAQGRLGRMAMAVAASLTAAFVLHPPLHAGGVGENPLEIISRQGPAGIQFFVVNRSVNAVTATFDAGLVNVSSDITFPFTDAFQAREMKPVFILCPSAGKPWHYSITNQFMIGNCHAVHDASVVYELPYERGKRFRVSQGYHGHFSHSGQDAYSIDFEVPEGTAVRAARGGRVVFVQTSFRLGGPDLLLKNQANYILVEHSDGTIGNYSHLQVNGAAVQVGDAVVVGDLLGYSGNTGYTSGPHLHFAVYRPLNGGARETIPIRFNTHLGQIESLRSGTAYQAPPAISLAEPIEFQRSPLQ